eukprot:scpid31054/ scgid29043/ DNA repair protein XRCC1; X-ray repair cross-complementing protein 1
MRELKLHQVVSFSSEDTVHKASNLLRSSGQQKWLCAAGGEKEASIILQLEKACEISSVDIGNAGSAFVEVLVCRSTSSEFQVLVVASSFMTPGDSKTWKNINSVRMFNKDALSKTTADQKWDRIKVVCRQPFNKVEKFGVSFVKFRGPGDVDDADVSASLSTASTTSAAGGVPSLASTPSFGKFNLRDAASSSNMSVGSLFATRNDQPTSTTAASSASSMAAQARDASSTLSAKAQPTTAATTGVPRRTPSPNPDASLKPSTSAAATSQKRKASPKMPRADSNSSANSTGGKDNAGQPPPAKRMRRTGGKKADVPFDEVLDGVVFALSGFQNPLRGNLRDKGLALGAEYRSQWETGCTHLVAAFQNTPKYKQVKGDRGIIVRKDWIEHCHTAKRRLTTKRFVFSAADASSSSSDDEDNDTRSTQPYRNVAAPATAAAAATKTTAAATSATASSTSHKGQSRNTSHSPRGSPQAKRKAVAAAARAAVNYSDSDDNTASTSAVRASTAVDREATAYSSGSDTEDELERLRVQQQQKDGSSPVGGDDAARSSSSSDTEVDEEMSALPAGHKAATPVKTTSISSSKATGTPSLVSNTVAAAAAASSSQRPTGGRPPRLASFYDGVHFLLFGDFKPSIRKALVRYVCAYGGVIEDYMSDDVTYVITDSEWDRNFDQALADVSTLKFVRPSWVMSCHDSQKRLPLDTYEIKKPE